MINQRRKRKEAYGVKKKNMSRLESFGHAFHGLAELIKTETNFKIELFMGAAALGLCGVFRVTRLEWVLIILCCALVLAMEGANTAVEKTVDLVTEEYRELARIAKDVAAGAVLLSAMGAAATGIIIFYPYLQQWISRGK